MFLWQALQVDLYDPDMPEAWKQGFFMKAIDRKGFIKK
jgi:hypothetical protein